MVLEFVENKDLVQTFYPADDYSVEMTFTNEINPSGYYSRPEEKMDTLCQNVSKIQLEEIVHSVLRDNQIILNPYELMGRSGDTFKELALNASTGKEEVIEGKAGECMFNSGYRPTLPAILTAIGDKITEALANSNDYFQSVAITLSANSTQEKITHIIKP